MAILIPFAKICAAIAPCYAVYKYSGYTHKDIITLATDTLIVVPMNIVPFIMVRT